MRLGSAFGLIAAAVFTFMAGSGAVAAERRLALVIGESAYAVKPIATAANDAGLIAQTLQAAGFDVTGARDLEEAALKQSFRDFLDKVSEAGPDAVAFVYFSGYGLQLEGENYLVPVDARIARDVDIPMRALRVSDYLKPLAASGAKLSVVVLDAARANPFQLSGEALAGGFALYEPGAKALLAYNTAPGAVAPEATGDYGAYAHALAEMIRDGGRPLMEVFENTRLRVSAATKGAQVPWNSQRVETDFVFFQRDASAPPRVEDTAKLSQPINALGPEDGYSAAVRRDTLKGYEEYVAAYPSAPYARRARAILAARREALTWRRTRVVDSPNAYWSYLRHYPKGPHAWDARRRLAEMRYEAEPPPRFDMIDYDFAPPPPEEIVYVERPVVVFDDPMWGFAPPPPPPVYFLPPPPPDFIVLPPPIIIAQPYVLPAPQYVPIPVWQRPPPHITPPPENLIYANVHNSVALDPGANNVVVRNPAGGVISTGALTAVGAGAAAVAVGAALPHFIAKRNPPPGMMAPPGAAPGGAIGGAAPIAAPAQPAPVGGLLPNGAKPSGPLSAPIGREAQPLPKGPGLLPGAPAPHAQDGVAGGSAVPPAPGGLPKGEALPKPAPGGLATPGGAEPPGRGSIAKDHALPTPTGPLLQQGAGPDHPATPPGASPKGEALSKPVPGSLADPGVEPPGRGSTAKDQALPTPPGPATPHGAGAVDHVMPTPGGSRGIAASPPGSRNPPRGTSEGRAPSPVGRGAGRGPDAPLGGPGQPARPRDTPPERRAAPRDFDGGPARQPVRARDMSPRGQFDGVMPPGGVPHMGAPMGMTPPPERAQPRLRRAPPQDGARPQGMPQQPTRGFPRGAMPGRAEPMAAPQFRGGPPGGMPPQMRQMAPPPAMAPQPMRAAPAGPPAGMVRQPPAPPPQAAPAMMRPSGPPPGSRGGGSGGFGGPPPGFGGMR